MTSINVLILARPNDPGLSALGILAKGPLAVAVLGLGGLSWFLLRRQWKLLLEMNAHEVHFLVRRRDILLRVFWVSEIVQRHAAVGAERHVVLRNLVVLRHVRIKIIFAVEL